MTGNNAFLKGVVVNDLSAVPTIPELWPAQSEARQGIRHTMRKTARRWPPSPPQPNHARIAELANDLLETGIKLLVLVETVRLGSRPTANGGLPNV